jgi:hypothetical protein
MVHGEFNLSIGEMLLKAGDDINGLNRFGNGMIYTVLKSLTGAGKNLYFDQEKDQEKRMALQQEVKKAKANLKWLLHNGADPDRCNHLDLDVFQVYDKHMWADHVMAKIPFRNWLADLVAEVKNDKS